MSVQRIDYVVYGWKMKYIPNVYENEKLLPYLQGHKGIEFSLISDTMNGQYQVFGVVISKSDEIYVDFDFKEINIKKMNEKTDLLIDKYYDLFDELPNSLPDLIVFSHFN
jgi:hypothetical protein